MSRGSVPTLVEAREYDRQEAVAVACTQLGTDYTPSRARRVVDEWIELLAHPTSLRDLRFTTRTPKRLFAALVGQPQLSRLAVKWGDYSDLSALEPLTHLRALELRGASAVTELGSLSKLQELEVLALEGFRRIDDPHRSRG